MRSIILLLVACPALPYVSILFHKSNDFQKNSIKCKMFVLIFSATFYETFLTLRKLLRDTIIGLHVNYPLFLSDVTETWILSTDFRKILFHEHPSSGSRVVLYG